MSDNQRFTNQQEFISHFNNDSKNRYDFNADIFKRSDEKIIYYLQLIYRSIQRTMGLNSYFTIEVLNFEVIEDYDEVRKLLSKYNEVLINKSVKLKNFQDNRYEYVDLKQTDLKLLITTFKLEAYDGSTTYQSMIAVPRVVNKFYFHINGHYLVPMFQLVDASTYNNQTSNAKYPLVVFKNIFPPINLFRNSSILIDIYGNEVSAISYEVDIFKKSVSAVEYIFASFGLQYGLQFLGLDGYVHISDRPPAGDHTFYYIFAPKKATNLFIYIPRSLYDANYVAQHVISTLYYELSRKFMTLENVNEKDIWLEALGRHFSLSGSREKAISVLTSFESLYDLITYENTRLPENDKRDIYCILRWMIYEYSALILKDNLDVSIKRYRIEEYIAGLIAPKISKAIYALSDMGQKANLDHIKKRINIPYDFLIGEIVKESIIMYADMVTDNDSYIGARYSRGGPSAISSEKGSAALPMVYRLLHISSLGILDDSASSSANPGTSGLMSGTTKMYPHGYVVSEEEYSEPNTWREELFRQLDRVRLEMGKKEVVKFKDRVLEQSYFPELPIKDFQLTEEQRQHLLDTANR